MPKYVLVYNAGPGEKPDLAQLSQEEMQAGLAAWGAWYGSMGDALVDGGNPFSVSSRVMPGGASADAASGVLTGYTIVSAADMAAAQEIAKGSPALEDGISVDIYEAVEMPEM